MKRSEQKQKIVLDVSSTGVEFRVADPDPRILVGSGSKVWKAQLRIISTFIINYIKKTSNYNIRVCNVTGFYPDAVNLTTDPDPGQYYITGSVTARCWSQIKFLS